MSLRPFALTAALALTTAPVLAQENYQFDEGHTEVLFSWTHAGISTQTAEFTGLDGEIVIERDDVAASRVDVTIDPASIHTGFELFDEHLVSGDWFDVESHPEIRFVSTAVRQVATDRALIDGDLTIKGITHPVTLDATLTFDGPHPLGEFVEAYQADYVGFAATAMVPRSAWDLGAYAPLTSDTVEITINTELRRVDVES